MINRALGFACARLQQLAQLLGLKDGLALEVLAAELVALRAERRLPVASWSTRGLIAALQLSLQRGWPADRAVEVLRQVAADPATRSPMRLAESGPWWDPPAVPGLCRTRQEDDELERLESVLAERDDRAWLQSRARAALLTSGQTVDRLSVARRATRPAEQDHPAAGIQHPAAKGRLTRPRSDAAVTPSNRRDGTPSPRTGVKPSNRQTVIEENPA